MLHALLRRGHVIRGSRGSGQYYCLVGVISVSLKYYLKISFRSAVLALLDFGGMSVTYVFLRKSVRLPDKVRIWGFWAKEVSRSSVHDLRNSGILAFEGFYEP